MTEREQQHRKEAARALLQTEGWRLLVGSLVSSMQALGPMSRDPALNAESRMHAGGRLDAMIEIMQMVARWAEQPSLIDEHGLALLAHVTPAWAAQPARERPATPEPTETERHALIAQMRHERQHQQGGGMLA